MISTATITPCDVLSTLPLPQVATLPDGGVALLRSVILEDGERLRRMFYRLSSETRQRWFFVAAPSQPHWAERVAALAAIDDHTCYAVVALVEDEIVGIARYDLAQEAAGGAVEVGMLIEDAWQSRHLGSLMACCLVAAAQRQGIISFTARILGENRRALRLAVKTLPDAHVTWGGGEFEVCAQLGQPDAEAESDPDGGTT